MTRAPFVVPRPETAFPGKLDVYSTTVGWRMVNPRFPDRWTLSLGESVDLLAREYNVTRTEQDEWALRSHQLADQAWGAGLLDGSIVAVDGVERDESIRADTSLEKLARLAPAFSEEGTVTAGNASPINDGAAALLIGSQAAARSLEVEPRRSVVASAVVGVEPERFAIAPAGAIRKLLDRTGIAFADLAVVEINEAFAGMVLCCLRDLPELDRELVNPHGGAIAYGHPLGASMPRVVMMLLDELERRGGGRGVATACIGVGQGIAILCEVA
jgi:acetyl-CoA acyltransferase